MSTQVTTLFTTTFDPLIHSAFQRNMPLLKGKTRMASPTNGSSHKFRKNTSILTMAQKARHGDIPLAAQSYAEVTCTMEDWWLADLVNGFDQNKTNITLLSDTADTLAPAAARRYDQTIIDALDDSTPDLVLTVGAFTPSVIERTRLALKKNDVPFSDLIGVISPEAADDLLKNADFASIDFNNSKPRVDGLKDQFVYGGVNWTVHTGLTEGGSTYNKCYVFHKSAVGVVVHEEGPSIRYDFIGRKGEDQVSVKLSMGACVIDTRAIVEIQVDQ